MPSNELDDVTEVTFWRTRMLLAAVVFALLGNVYLVARCNQLEAVIAANSAAMRAQIRRLVRTSRDTVPSKETPVQRQSDTHPQIANAGPQLDEQH